MVLAFDIGTSVLKGGIINERGDLIEKAQASLDLTGGGHPLYHETDAEIWISSMSKAASRLNISDGKDIRAVVISGNGPTLVPVGVNGRPLDTAMSWMDRRGVREAEQIAEIIGEYVDPTFHLPKAF